MTPDAAGISPSFLFCALCILLVPFAGAGLALINAGAVRSRNAAHAMMSTLCVLAISAVVFFLFGFAWQSYSGRSAFALSVGGKAWNWIGADAFFLRGVDPSSPAALAAWLGMFAAGLASVIPLGAGAERLRLAGACAASVAIAGWTYPLFAHWAWGGGWLAQLGSQYELGRGFVDAGGTASIQVVGGLTALSVVWILGPRRGKFPRNDMPAAIPGHNAVFILLGCMLALAGWLGLNQAGAMLFSDVGSSRVAQVGIYTMLSASSAAIAAALLTKTKFGKPDASLTANGWIGGLVASSAGCAFAPPAAALVIGAAAGLLVVLSVEFLELRLHVDDPSGAISVHGVAGIWGLLAIGMFGGSGQWLAQLIGVATLLGFVLPMTFGINALLNRFVAYRVSPDGERHGMDLHELGANAYPELSSHADEFLPH